MMMGSKDTCRSFCLGFHQCIRFPSLVKISYFTDVSQKSNVSVSVKEVSQISNECLSMK